MLMANIAVAEQIYNKYPEKAILRRHPSPNAKQLQRLDDMICSFGFDCDMSTSHSIHVCDHKEIGFFV